MHEPHSMAGRTRPTPPSALLVERAPVFLLLAGLLVAGALQTLAPAAAGAQADRDREVYTLEELLEMGRSQNPSVLALRARETAMEAQRRDAGSWANPELGLEVGEGEPFASEETRTIRGVSLRQVIENPYTRHHRLQALDRRKEATGEDLRLGILDTEYQIRMHFYRVLYLRELLRLARLNEEALAGIRELVETRARVGEVRELEAIRLRVEHLRAENEVEAAVMELEQYRKHLNTFLGNVLPPDYTLEGSLDYQAGEPELEDLVAEALPGHPRVIRARREREAAGAELRGARWGWLPDPVLSGSSNRVLDGTIRRLGLGLQLPLWNRSRQAARKEEEELRAAEHRETAIRQELEAQLMIHHNHLRLARQTIQFFEEGLLREARASMEIAETSYRQGEISFVEYLDARRTYHSIQIERQQALFDWNRERAALDRAAGGRTS